MLHLVVKGRLLKTFRQA